MLDVVITRRTGTYSDLDPEPLWIWEAHDQSGIASALYVSHTRHEIVQVETRDDRRRQGLATALYETACSETDIYHAPEGHRTEQGDAFARRVGGETVPPYPCDCAACDVEVDDDEVDDRY